MSMDDTIKLDRRSFEALAADSRIRILKSLAQQRKTLTELAKELNLSNSTMKEHLDVLVRAGLIIQRDEGRKWKYYDLTRKGEGIVNPHPTKVLIMLAVSMILVIASGWNFVGAYGDYSGGVHSVVPMLGGSAVAEYSEGSASSYAMRTDAPPAPEPMFAVATEEYAANGELTQKDSSGNFEETNLVAAPNEASWEMEAEMPPAEAIEEPFPWGAALLLLLSTCLLGASVYYLFKRW